LLSDIQNVADSLDRYGRQILNLRSEADTQIVSEIATINNALAQVHSLNNLISHEKETGGNPAALEEQRARAIEKISDIVDIRAVEKTNHKVEISTISGLSLLDDRLRVLQYNPPGQVETTVVFNSITVHHIDSTTGLPSATGVALEPNLRAGTLKGLVDTRDKELPDVALSLGEMSSKFIDLINQVHNENTAVPPPNTLTGRNVGALATDPHGFTGKMTFGILDSNNILTSSYEIDFAAPGLVTLQDVITNVNGNITGGTLALSNGVMSFDATAGTDGVSLLQNATTPSARGGRGFSHYFGMNDLLSGREVAHFDTGLTTASGHGFGASGTVSLEFRGPGGILADSHTLDFSAVGSTVANVLTDLNTAFTGYATFTMDSNGKLVLTPAAGYEDYDMKARTDTTARGATAVSFSSYFGVGDHHRMDAAFNIVVDPTIVASTGKLALARLDTAAASGIPALNNGDNRGANAFVALSAAVSNFALAGDLPGTSTTLANYGNYFLSNIGLEADRLASLAEDRMILKEELGIRRDSMTGINLDEELAAMVQYQNAYNAAARIIAAVNEMYETLLRM
ncbi:MAG: hypothetical protein HOC72_11710, partial [Rhodospirillaceae bacterium]|nr:hypothetical protein [Rhodospirillaceae bacterium]